ncbi:MAG TPA: hypothetical protein VIL87_12765, partial [Dermatophilaceae bacterium]
MHSTAEKTSKKWDATANASRVLLLSSALLVMTFTRGGLSHTPAALMALAMATLAAGVSLLHPIALRDLVRLRRAELTLIGTLLLAGLVFSAGTLALALADLGSPGWFAVIAAYATLGVVGALSLGRRLFPLRWAFPMFLVAHTAMTIVLIRSSQPHIDVHVFLHDGAIAVLHGHNPYAMTFPDIYPSQLSDLLYGPGVVMDGRITYGFPYLPVSLLVAIPGQLLGDVRYSQLIAMIVTALVLRRLASDQVGRAAAVLGVASVSAIPVLNGAWTEPTIVALLACLVLALERRRYSFVAVFLGLFVVSKQYVVIAIPIIWLIHQWLTRRVILISVGVAAVATLPFFLIDPAAFWKTIVQYQLIQPFRADSVSLLVSSVNTFSWPPPWTYGALPLLGGGLTALAVALRAPRTPAAFAAGVG